MNMLIVMLIVWLSMWIASADAAAVKYSEAQLNQAIQEDADDARAWFRLGVLQTHDGRILQAMEAFRQVIRIKPDAVEPHHNLAAIYESLDDFDAAADELKQVIELNPRDVQSQVELAAIYLKQVDGIYRSIARRDPENRTVQQDHLAQLMCRQALTKVRGNDAMERTLQRIMAPVAGSRSVVAPQRFPVPERELRDRAAVAAAVSPPAVISHVSKGRVAEVPSVNAPKPKVAGAKRGDHRDVVKPRLKSKQRAANHHRGGSNPPVAAKPHRAERTQPAPQSRQRERVLATVEEWRKGWQSRDLKRYLSFYSHDFRPPKWSLKLWHAHKANVFRKAKFVRVRLRNIRVKVLSRSRVRVTFEQSYRSDYYQALSNKEMVWVDEKGVWKVLRESSVEIH
ncbi:MAG: tetratricopeptide repeat protein [Mariprofundales bacterium]|nr:tetratricopeptide repeat protein [Mariprofundales bacterium]